jgi:cobalt-zinc-cadmium efflux system protein
MVMPEKGEHDHAHGHGQRHDAAEKALWVAFVLNLVFLVVELAVGLWTNSLALLSDAGHMVSDVAALAIALVAQRLARTRPGGGYTFGLRRVPVLGAFGNALALLVIAGFIVWEALGRLQSPEAVMATPVLIVGTAGLVVNLVSAWWLHRQSRESLNVRGAFLHMLADALGSVGAIVAAVVMLATGWVPIDALVSMVIALLILIGTWPLLRDSARVLLQIAPAGIDIEKLQEELCQAPEVAAASHMHVWEVDTGFVILTATLVATHGDLAALDRAADRLRERLNQEFGIHHATFEWRTCEDDDERCNL